MHSAFLGLESEEDSDFIIVDDGKFFYFWVIIKIPTDIDPILIHADLDTLGSVIFHEHIDSDEDEDHDAHRIEPDEKSPDDERE